MKRLKCTFLNWRCLGIGLLLLGSLSGCGQEAETLARETIAEVASYKDPTLALEKLRAAELALSQICSGAGANCVGPVAQLIEAQRRIIGEAVKLGDSRAIRDIFSRGSLMSMQQELAPMVMQMAQQSNDPNIMATAAHILGDEQFGARNSTGQIDYLLKAWRLGDSQSSGDLANLLERRGDDQNAYLWSLRCLGECRRQQTVELAMLERKLGIAKMEAIQALVADKTVLNVGRNPLGMN